MVVIEDSVKGMPCYKNEKLSTPPIKLANKMDISQKKLMITGWWWLAHQPIDGFSGILAVGENEITQFRRVFLFYQRQAWNTLYSEMKYDSNSVSEVIASSYTVVNSFIEKWTQIIASVDLDQQFLSLHFYFPESDQTFWKLITGANLYTSFSNNHYISIGTDSITNDQDPGCGKVADVRLYPNFAYAQQNEIDFLILIKHETKIQLYYPFSQASDYLQDKDNFKFIYNSGTGVPQVDTLSLLMSSGKQLTLPEISQIYGEILINFWIQSPAATAETFIILKMVELGSNIPLITLSMIPGSPNNYQILKINYKGTDTQLTSLNQFLLNSWYSILISCHQIQGNQQKLQCNFIQYSNSITRSSQMTNHTDDYGRFKRVKYQLGDTSNTASFRIRNLIIGDGSLYNLKDSTSNCINNCELYLSNGYCLICASGYVLDPSQSNTCIATASCSSVDSNINICQAQQTICSGQSDSQIYQNFFKAPTCNACQDYFYKNGNDCQPCKVGCLSCSDLSSCSSCPSGRTGANCDCANGYYDDKKSSECIYKQSTTQYIPSFTKYVKLDIKDFSTNQCGTNPAVPQNKLDIPQNTLQSTESKKLSFSFWSYSSATVNTYEWVHQFNLHRQPIEDANRILSIHQKTLNTPYTLNVMTKQTTLIQISHQMPINQWFWIFVTLDTSASSSISSIYYRPATAQWNFQVKSQTYYTDLTAVTDLQAHFGTVNTLNYQDCTMLGKLNNAFYYQGISAAEIQLEYQTLYQMMQYPDIPIMSWKITQSYSQVSTINDEFSTSTITKPTPSANSATFQEFKGIIISGPQYVQLTLFDTNDFTIHYWWYREFYYNDNANMIIYSRQSQQITLESLSHHPKLGKKVYQLQICVFQMCIWDQNDILTGKWNFIAANFHIDYFKYVIVIQSFVNAKHSTFSVINSYQGSTTNIKITLGSTNNTSPNEFWIKDFGIDQGGALLNYDNGGYSASNLPNCVLKTYKSSLNSGSGYCLLCEWGYYVNNGTCTQSLRYCNSIGLDCVYPCPNGQVFDSYLPSYTCVTTCKLSLYYFIDTSKSICVSPCPNNYYGDPTTQQCVLNCPSGFYPNLKTKICEQTLIPCANKVVYLEKYLRGMPCKQQEILFSDTTNNLQNRIDISKKKLTVTGWWLLQSTSNTNTIFSIQESESQNQYKRALAIQYTYQNKAIFIEQQASTCPNAAVGGGLNLNNIINEQNSTFFNFFHNQWIFIVASIDLDLSYYSVQLYSQAAGIHRPWVKQTGANCYTNFNANQYINYGINQLSTANNLYPGCGLTKNVRLYYDFAYSQQYQIPTHLLTKEEANVLIYYGMSTPGSSIMLIDQSGNKNHAKSVGDSNIDPTWDTGNKGVKFNANKYISLPEIAQSTNGYLISFWVKTPTTLQEFKIIQLVKEFENTKELILQIAPDATNAFGVFSIQAISGSNLITNQLTYLHQFAISSWYHILTSCSLTLTNELICNTTSSSNGIDFQQDSTSYLNSQRSTRIRYILGDSANSGNSFTLRELIIADGSIYSFKNNFEDCVSNCKLYLSSGICILCSTGYVQSGGSCIAQGLCTTIDTEVNICVSQASICSYQLFKPPTCTSCLDQYYKSGTVCLNCKFGCQQCSSESTCTLCLGNRQGTNCECPAQYLDGLFYPDCILKAQSKVPPYVKYLSLQQSSFTTISCGSNPANPVNQYDSVLSASTISTSGGNKISFTLWVYVTNLGTDNWVHALYLHRQPINRFQRILALALNYNLNYYNIKTQNEGPSISFAINTNSLQQKWFWYFISLDVSSQILSSIIYSPFTQIWVYQQISSALWNQIDYSDLQVHVGTQHPGGPGDCTMSGNLASVFFYQGIVATDVGMDYSILHQMISQPDLPIAFWKVTPETKGNQVLQDIYSTATLQRGPTNNEDVNFDPTFHILKGMVFSKQNSAVVQLFSSTDFTLHYWFYKQQVNTNVITYISLNNTQLVQMIKHVAQLQDGAYLLQVCLFDFCAMDSTILLPIAKWNFIAVTVHFDFVKVYKIQTFINTKYRSYTIDNKAQTITMTSITLGHSSNQHTDQFSIKDFGIDMGGALLTVDMGGVTSSGTEILPHCLLRSYKSSLLASNQYCLYCEWGYYIQNGTCTQGYYYCNEQQSDCVTFCPVGSGLFLDSVNYDCVTLCPTGYFADSTTYKCVQTCPAPLYFGNSFTKTCVQTCPALYYGDPLSRKCVMDCPTNYFADETTRLCSSPCPNSQFGNPNTKLCVQTCPLGLFGDVVSYKCATSCPSGYFSDSLSQLCTQNCPNGYFKDSTVNKCTLKCPNSYFADLPTKSCSTSCTAPLLADKTTNQCVSQCPYGYFGDSTTAKCVTTCPINQYGDSVSVTCLTRCPNGYFGDPTTIQCSTVCPKIYYQDILTNLCTVLCSSTQFSDPQSKKCVSICPNGLYGDTMTKQCTAQCQTGYFASSLNQQCVSSCPNNQFGDENTLACVNKCPVGLMGDQSIKKCVISCSSDTYQDLTLNVCVANCPSGLFGDPLTKTCLQSCASSNLYSDSTLGLCVTTCSGSLFGDTKTFQCVSTCATDYFGETIKKQCVRPCPGGFFGDIVSKQCVINCPTGYFGDAFTQKCSSTCSNSQYGDSLTKQCAFTCSANQFGDQLQGQCITTCPSGYFGNTLNKLCVSACPMTRFGDPSTVKCEQKCSNGYFGDSDTGLCVVTCPANYFGDIFLNRCVLVCSSNSFADPSSGLCVTTCPTNSFGDQLTKQCISTCQVPFYGDITTSKCVPKCPNGYFGDSLSRKCVTNCLNNLYGDTAINLCVQYCSSGQYINLQAKQCVTSCPAGLFGDYTTMQCVSNCTQGQYGDPSTSKCVSTCPTTYYADPTVTKKCVQQCPAGQFGDALTVKCVSICSSGQYGDSTLQVCVRTCSSPQFGDSSTWKCVGICPDGTYGDSYSQKCNKVCQENYYADPSTKTCVQDCPATLFADQQEGKCLQSCSTFGYYGDPVLHKCVIQCSIDYFGEPITFKCVQTCPTSYQQDSKSRKCVITCPSDLFGDPTTLQCGSSCPTNYYKDISTWMCVLRCPKNYFSIESTKECTLYCPSGSYGDPTTSKCIQQCLTGYFGNSIVLAALQETLRICELCDQSCNQCTAASNFFCVQCADGYYQKTHTNSSLQCLPCHSLCKQCFGETQFNCTTCQPLTILHSQSCTEKCQEFPRMFADPYILQCRPCNPICQSCSGPTQFECIQCINGYFLTNFICKECISPCVFCYGPDSNQCQSCVAGYYLEEPSTCKLCPDVCLTCTNAQTCQSCQSNRGSQQCNCSLLPDSIDYYPKSMWCGTCEVSVLSITFSTDWTQIKIELGFEVTLSNYPQQLETPSQDMCNYLFPQAIISKFGQSPTCNLKQTTRDSIIINLGNAATILLNDVIQFNQQTVTKKSCDGGGQGPPQSFSFYDQNITKSAVQPNPFSVVIQSANKTYQKCEEINIKIGNILNDGSRGIKYLNWSLTGMSPLDKVTRTAITEIILESNQNQTNNITFPSSLLRNQTNYTFNIYCENFFNQNTTAEINISIYIAEQQQYCSECYNVSQNFICSKCLTGVIHQENICTLSCKEFPGNYPDILAQKCKPCDPMCKSCTGSSANDCTVCTNQFYLEGQVCMNCDVACYTCSGPASDQCSACNDGYFYEPESQCLACPEVCKTCVSLKNCTSCKFNRVGQHCDCPPTEGIPYVHTNWCGTCQLAVVSVYFASDWLSIIIDFGVTVVLTKTTDQEAPSNQKCQDIFPANIYSKLGTTANCSLAILKRDKIIIQLDQSATILLKQEFSLNPNSVYRKDCSTQKTFGTIINGLLQSNNNEISEFKVTLKGPNYRPTLCEQITIQIDKIFNDGHRGLKNFTWSLVSVAPSNQANQANVESILTQANQNKLTNITFAAQSFIQNTEYIFQLLGYNWFDQNYTAFFTLHTSYSEGILLKLDNQSDQAVYPRYQNITLKVFFKHLVCQNDGTFQEISDSIKYQWQQLQQANNLSLGINETSDISSPGTNYSEIVIPPYTAKALNLYDVQFTVSLININVSQSIIIKLNISQSALQASINGGSRVASISQSFNLSGKALDRDVNPNYPDQLEGMSFIWECQDLNSLSSCYDIKGNLINLEQNKLEQKYNKKTFLAYKSYKFIFTVVKGDRVKSTEAIIMFIEIDLPQLAMDVPSQYLENRINLQDQIYLSMQYSNKYNPDTLFYSAVIIYDYEEVAIMIFDYLQVRFRIWDYFTNFNYSNIDLIIRFSIYNPLFIMPSQIMIPFKVNTVPKNCSLNINPSIGDSLLTNFQLTVSGCQDQDMPLSYQFFVYMSIQEQQEELIDQLLLKRNQLIDHNSQPTLTTQLPQGYQDFSMKLVIMASIKDSFGGIANITQNVTVNKNNFVVNNDQVNYLQTLKQMFQQTQNSGMDVDTQMRLLSLIVIDYTSSAILQPTSLDFNALKMMILDKLYLIKQQISGSNSTWDQQITRLIGIIMKNSTSLISSISKADADKQLNNMGDIVNNVGSQLKTMSLDGSDGSESEKASKLDTLLVNCAQAVDGMLIGINNNNKSNSTSALNDSNIQNQQMMNITQEISKLMVLNALPNENPKLYLGETLKIKSQIITPKHLSNYLGSEIKDWSDSSQEDDEQKDSNFTLQMFKVAFKSYNINPFADDPKFPYANKTFKVIDPGIYQGNSSEKINITQSITHIFNVKQENLNASINTTSSSGSLLRKGRYLGQETKTFKCISLGVNKEWSPEQCEKFEQKQPDGTMTVKCICKDLSIATIGEDIVNIFADNKNIQLILSDEGLSKLQNLEFYKYIIFYVGTVITLLWFFLIYKGIQLDQLTTSISQVQIGDKPSLKITTAQESIQPYEQLPVIGQSNTPTIQEQEKLEPNNKKINSADQLVVVESNSKLVQKNLMLLVQTHSEKQSLQNKNKKHQQKDNLESLFEVISIQEVSPAKQKLSEDQKDATSIQSRPKSCGNQKLNDQIQQEAMQLNNENKEIPNKNPLQQGDMSKDKINQSNIQDQNQQKGQIDLDKIQDTPSNQKQQIKQLEITKKIQKRHKQQAEIEESKDQKQQAIKSQRKVEKKLTSAQATINFLTGVISYHEFFSIFSLIEPSISRPVRFTLYYIKTIYLMAMTIIFSQTLNPIQTIVLSALSGIAYSIIASLIKLLLRVSKILKVIGILVSMGICFVCWYSTLVITATMTPEESNYWSLQFFGTFFCDNILIQLLVGTTKYSIFLLLVKRSSNLSGIFKILSEIIIKTLMNQKLKNAFSRFH